MVEEDQIARWILGLGSNDLADAQTSKLLKSSRLAWPRVLAHTRKELAGQQLSPQEINSVAFEIWEVVLRSVWKTIQRRPANETEIANLENYLIGAFHHRLNRHLKLRRRNAGMIQFLPPEDLAELGNTKQSSRNQATLTEDRIQLREVYAMIDDNARKAVIARLYGFSWSDIAKTFEMEEQNLIMRVQYAIRKVRQKLTKTRTATTK
jgi:DNA-directed RNA polymerase specialized sigma24 family protein